MVLDGLKENDIPSLLYYPVPIHQLPVFAHLESYDEMFENATEYSEEFWGIPFSPYLPMKDQDKVREVLNRVQ